MSRSALGRIGQVTFLHAPPGTPGPWIPRSPSFNLTTVELAPKPFRHIQCRRLIRSPKGVSEAQRQRLEACVRNVTARGMRYEDTQGFGPEHAINRFLSVLQVELVHSEYGDQLPS